MRDVLNSPAERQQSRQARAKTVVPYAMGLIGCVIAVLIWHLLTVNASSSLHRFRPVDTLRSGWSLLESPRFWSGVIESMRRLLGALGMAVAIGVPVGIAIGYSKIANELTYVPFQFLRMISPLSWTPVAIITLGVGAGPVYFLVTTAAVWPIIINTAAGVRSTNPEWIAVARCLGAGHWGIIRFILVRGTLPSILVGLQLALGVGWIVLVPAEMLGVASGLGYMILDFRDINDYASIMALILIIGLLGLCLDLPLRWAVRVVSWH